MEASNLAVFWAAVLSVSILIYVLLDGFDLGVGILFGTTSNEQHKVHMMSSIAPFWDGNETWLVVIAAGLFATFPAVYASFLGAFYLPVLLLLFGLIFRGIAFEFRFRSETNQHLWDRGFFLGSIAATFVQGAAIGAMILGIPVVDGQYAGGPLLWLAPFPMLTGLGLVLGYALLGAGWLVLKTEGELREWAYARIPWLVVAILLVLGLAFAFTFDYSVIARGHLGERSWGRIFPVIALLALAGTFFGALKKHDRIPYTMTALFFTSSFLTLGVMFWPHMLPYSLTVANAAAPEASLQFFFYAGIVVMPIIAIYTIGVYWVFRGKLILGQAE